MSRSFENRERRRAVWAFIAAYFTFLLTLIVLEIERSHSGGYGFF